MPVNPVTPLKDSSEGYEEDFNPNNDGVVAAGFYPQPLGPPVAVDTTVGIERDGSSNLVFKDPLAGTMTLTEVLASATGITESAHKTLLQLIHFIDEGPAEGFTTGATKTVTGGIFPSQILWRRADATKLVEQNITWAAAKPTIVEWKMYAANGSTVLATVTDTISYSGAFETGRTRTIV